MLFRSTRLPRRGGGVRRTRRRALPRGGRGPRPPSRARRWFAREAARLGIPPPLRGRARFDRPGMARRRRPEPLRSDGGKPGSFALDEFEQGAGFLRVLQGPVSQVAWLPLLQYGLELPPRLGAPSFLNERLGQTHAHSGKLRIELKPLPEHLLGLVQV